MEKKLKGAQDLAGAIKTKPPPPPNCTNYIVTTPYNCIKVGSILFWCQMAVYLLYKL